MKKGFGCLPDGQAVTEYELCGGVLRCGILDYGATVRTLTVPDRCGRPRDVVLGFDSLQGYLQNRCYLGATVGRCANRIGGAEIHLGGRRFPLSANEGRNHLHGGASGFDRRLWTAELAEEDRLILSLVSPDGDQGYPGTLRVSVSFTLADAALRIEYRAVCDADTVCNLTNHSYFNLDGHDGGSVLRQRVRIPADFYTPADAAGVPDGRVLPVDGTPMDLREWTPIGAHVDEDFPQLRLARGYDRNYVPRGSGLREAARAGSAESGIGLRVLSTQPSLQFYTGNWLHGCPAGKAGAVYDDRTGFCFEAQGFPDAPHHPAFPSVLLRAGETYRQTIVFQFSADA